MLESVLSPPSFPRRRESKLCQRLSAIFLGALLPGVARRLLTFLASPRKVSKRRRPQSCRPDEETVGVLCATRISGAAAELVARIGKNTNGSVCARHSDSPRRRLPAASPLLDGNNGDPGNALSMSPRRRPRPNLTLLNLDPRRRGDGTSLGCDHRKGQGPHESRRAAQQTRGKSARTV